MNKLISYWKTYLSEAKIEEKLNYFSNSDSEEKSCIISDTFGIFNGSVKGNIYTYYFYNCDTLNHYLRGRKNWYKGAKCFKVEYNFKTDNLKVIPLKKWNHKADENRMRML